MPRVVSRFHGRIAGFGTESGVRLVVGMWPRSPLGSFADVMVERADGHRILLAPSDEVAEFDATACAAPVAAATAASKRGTAGPCVR